MSQNPAYRCFQSVGEALRVADVPKSGRAVAAVELRDVVREYGQGHSAVRALDDVSITLADGEFLAVMGPSGSGKSTLLNLVGALDRPDSGSIAVGGRDIASLSIKDAARYRRREVGFVFQSFNLLPRLTVVENVAMPLMFDGVSVAARTRRAVEMLDALGMSHRPPTLSGGEKQRVAIARALVHQPRLLLADEPTGNLDSRNADAAMEVLSQLNRDRGQTIVLITHEADVARHATRVVHMLDGRFAEAAQGD